jgi:hypothetical protein
VRRALPFLRSGPQPLRDPRRLPGLEAWYDVGDIASLVYDGSNRVSLVADKSGKSTTNCLQAVGNGGAITASVPTGATLTTGAFTLIARVRCPLTNPASNSNVALLNDAASATIAGKELIVRFEGSGELRVLIFGATSSNFNRWTYSNFLSTYAGQIIHLAVVRNAAGNPTIYVNGTDVTASGSFDASSGAGWQTTVDTDYVVHGGASTQEGALFRSALYNVALNSSQVAADYGGAAQSGNVVWIDFGLAAKMASSFVCTTGQTVTINTSGATGARICGERDLYQGTVANQPVLTIAADGRHYLTFDGSNDYLKAAPFSLSQPETVHFVGSQVSWTNNDTAYDGNTTDSMALYQTTNGLGASPRVKQYGGAFGGALDTWALQTPALVSTLFSGAASLIRQNRQAPVLGSAGSTAAGGFTLGTNGGGGGAGNVTTSEVAIYSQAHPISVLDRFWGYAQRKWRLAA